MFSFICVFFNFFQTMFCSLHCTILSPPSLLISDYFVIFAIIKEIYFHYFLSGFCIIICRSANHFCGVKLHITNLLNSFILTFSSVRNIQCFYTSDCIMCKQMQQYHSSKLIAFYFSFLPNCSAKDLQNYVEQKWQKWIS